MFRKSQIFVLKFFMEILVLSFGIGFKNVYLRIIKFVSLKFWKFFHRIVQFGMKISVLSIEIGVENLVMESFNLCWNSRIWVLKFVFKISVLSFQICVGNFSFESWNLCRKENLCLDSGIFRLISKIYLSNHKICVE